MVRKLGRGLIVPRHNIIYNNMSPYPGYYSSIGIAM